MNILENFSYLFWCWNWRLGDRVLLCIATKVFFKNVKKTFKDLTRALKVPITWKSLRSQISNISYQFQTVIIFRWTETEIKRTWVWTENPSDLLRILLIIWSTQKVNICIQISRQMPPLESDIYTFSFELKGREESTAAEVSG